MLTKWLDLGFSNNFTCNSSYLGSFYSSNFWNYFIISNKNLSTEILIQNFLQIGQTGLSGYMILIDFTYVLRSKTYGWSQNSPLIGI